MSDSEQTYDPVSDQWLQDQIAVCQESRDYAVGLCQDPKRAHFFSLTIAALSELRDRRRRERQAAPSQAAPSQTTAPERAPKNPFPFGTRVRWQRVAGQWEAGVVLGIAAVDLESGALTAYFIRRDGDGRRITQDSAKLALLRPGETLSLPAAVSAPFPKNWQAGMDLTEPEPPPAVPKLALNPFDPDAKKTKRDDLS